MSFRLFQVSFKHFDLFVTTWTVNVPFGAAYSLAQHAKNAPQPRRHNENRTAPPTLRWKTLNFSPPNYTRRLAWMKKTNKS
jgi:hypothetical protein